MKRCAACGATQLLSYDRSRKKYFCISKIHCDERRAAWYAEHRPAKSTG